MGLVKEKREWGIALHKNAALLQGETLTLNEFRSVFYGCATDSIDTAALIMNLSSAEGTLGNRSWELYYTSMILFLLP